MRIIEVNNQESWPNLPGAFAQTWEWGEILRKEGKEVIRIAIYDEEEVVAQAQLIFNALPFGWRYAFCPKGPAFVSKLKTCNSKLKILESLCDFLFQRHCIFFRFEPDELELQVTSYKLQIARTIDINPPATVILSLEKNEEELMRGMHPKTRYNIRLAEKKGLRIQDEKDLNSLIKLMKQTGKRDKFKLHNKKHYREVLNSEMSRQIMIFFEKEPVATAVFIGAGETFTYLYGASDYEHRHLMAPYLAQWEGIKLGKKLGYKKYDFFGVAPLEKNENGDYVYDEDHQYAGVTRFKLGFGGEREEEAGTIDLVIDERKYFAYQLLRKVRRIF